jgi:hypothetical protein
VSREQVVAEVEYLADPAKGLLRRNGELISPEVATYSTTAAGRDYLAASGVE